MNLNEQSVVSEMKNEFYAPFKMWGGFEDAERKRIQEKDYCDTLCARDWKDPKCVRIGGINAMISRAITTPIKILFSIS